jgi:hypothetical protein
VRGGNVIVDGQIGIGTGLARLNTDADVLAAHSAGGGVFVAEANGVTLQKIGAVANTALGSYDLTANGAITIGTGGVNTTARRRQHHAQDHGQALSATIFRSGQTTLAIQAPTPTLVSVGNITGTPGTVARRQRRPGAALRHRFAPDGARGGQAERRRGCARGAVSGGGNVFVTDPNSVYAQHRSRRAECGTLGTYEITAGGTITVDGNVNATSGVTFVASSIINNATIANGGNANST